MIYIRWRILLASLLHHLVLFGAVLVFLWAVFLSLLRVLFFLLPQHQNLIMDVLNPVIGANVTFKKMQTSWHRIQPEVLLYDVNVWNAKHQVVMHVPQVTLRISLFHSLLHRKIEIGLLQIKEWHTKFYQDDQGQWQVAGIERLQTSPNTADEKVALEDFVDAMGHIKHLQLHQNNIIIQSKNYPRIELTNTDLDWYSKNGQFSVYGHTLLQGPSAAGLRFGAQFTQDAAQKLSGKVYFKLDDLNVAPWLTSQTWHHFVWNRGTVEGEIWSEWKKDQWEKFAANLHLKQFDIYQPHQEKPWGIEAAGATLIANGQFDQNKTLDFSVQSSQGKLQLAHIFRSLMPYESMDLMGKWTLDNTGNNSLAIKSIHLKMADADAWTTLNMQWSSQNEPQMQLLANVHFQDLMNVSHNLPAGIMPPSVVEWLDHSVKGRSASDAEMLWRGPVKHFPFQDHSGTMQIYGKVTDADLAYAADWPSIHHLDADLYFTSHAMHIVAEQGMMGNLSVANAIVDIPEFKQGSHLLIRDSLQADLSQAWDFLNHSPLKNNLSFLVGQTTAQGPFALKLNLDIPLSELDKTQYRGELDFNHDQLNFLSPPIHLKELVGHLIFDDKSLQTERLQTQWFEEIWQLRLSKFSGSPDIHIDFSGIAPLETWIKEAFQGASSWIKGKSRVVGHAIIGAKGKTFTLKLDSDLKGTNVNLPLGSEKPAALSTPFSVNLSKNFDQPILFKLKWAAPGGSFNLQTQNNVWNFATPYVVGVVRASMDTQGLWKVNLSRVDLRGFKSFDTSSLNTQQLPPFNIQASNVTLPSGTFFNTVQLKLRPLENGDGLIKDLVINQAAYSINATGGWNNTGQGMMSYLNGQLIAPDLEKALTALDLPSLAEANQAVANFELKWPGAVWAFDRQKLQGKLKITTGSGVFKDVSDQTISKINLGRMLDLLSLSALPSHLTSKFNDMTQQGFPFDHVEGEMGVMPAQMQDINFQITGPVANVALHGCMNTKNEQLNFVAEINPKLTGSLPLLATLAGGPILGAVGFVANEVLSPAVGKLSASYYVISGSENNPQTTKVDSIRAKQALDSCPV